ncbi:Glycerate dehydrogenase [Porphyridium purpureum]|uniref:Glycerate dehydrogenase n=1 Tax=Porphyridium purpureum TaxID=35688 RepID=A0A5J4Z4W5_PORPP|nr:Glycerate dehydrogenase [Porphyridium purpureum]|eukprot:POR7066..scf295_1
MSLSPSLFRFAGCDSARLGFSCLVAPCRIRVERMERGHAIHGSGTTQVSAMECGSMSLSRGWVSTLDGSASASAGSAVELCASASSNTVSLGGLQWDVYNPSGKYRVVVTKKLVGDLWLDVLTSRDFRVEVCQSELTLSQQQIMAAMGSRCDGVIGQLTEKWDDTLFVALKRAGGKAYSNVAVGFDNVDVDAATRHGIAMGNTPGVLTEATAEMAVSLVYACARRVVEADAYLRAGKWKNWLPTLFIGKLLSRKTVGIVGAGRIGSTVGLMLVRGAMMDLVYYDKYQNKQFEAKLDSFARALAEHGEEPIRWRRVDSVEDVLRAADVVSLHPNLDKTTFHLMNAERLKMMKPDAILINCARGPVVDETALVEHCRATPTFYAGLDVFEDEPQLKPGLDQLENVVIVPHIASATVWTRAGMSTLAACNVSSVVLGQPTLASLDILPHVNAPGATQVPPTAPAIVNAKALGLPAAAAPKM